MKKITSGIYIIENQINGKIYVGQSINLHKRWSSHKSAYKRYSEGRESCWHQALWNAFDKYGIKSFKYRVVATCPKKYLNKMEIKFIKIYNSYNIGYNCDKGGKGGVPSKPIYQFDTEGTLIKKWKSISEVCKELRYKSQNNIRAAEKNKNYQQLAYGYIWSFKNDGKKRSVYYNLYLKNKSKRVRSQNNIKITMLDFQGTVLHKFNSIKDCAKYLKVSQKNLSTSIKNCYGASNGIILLKENTSFQKAIQDLSVHRLYRKLITNRII